MNWLEEYNRRILFYDILHRNPQFFVGHDLNSFFMKKNLHKSTYTITFSSGKDSMGLMISLNSFLSDFSSDCKVRVRSKRVGASSRKVFSLVVRSGGSFSTFFLDFFLNVIIKNLRRRYLSLRHGLSNSGTLNLRFSNMSELELDDYFFFDLYGWSGNLALNYKPFKGHVINQLYNNLFLNIFRIKIGSNYEVSNRKG